MSDSEDDYMSDKLLQQCEQDIRPGLVFNRTTKRQYELEKKKKEIEAKRPKSNREREEELREKGLNTAISSENKGFKMLEKMGFKQGQSLGKTQSGLKEPIKIELKSSKSGIGVESHFKERIKKKMERNDDYLKKKLNDFQFNNKIKQARRFLEKDFYTAQKTCEDLDCRKNIDEPIQEFYWTRETIRKKRDIKEEDEEEEFNEEFASYITEENLVEIIDYLRSRHLYCMFCAFVATDDEDLKTSCPGPYRSDHDDG
ncbi:G patch domain-containing protein 11 [Asbolus verrucosus]|uniref:G patch domain-containing protein 11 n=1 Tax=Asbolus verrucosus TaxID=1661398 RepID=A0A482VEG6_ASBVE|nr:G patch domain-containing protein 11 [Asbolus verrucosus]